MSKAQLVSLIQDVGITTSEEMKDFLQTSLQWTKFSETYFKNPDDIEQPLVLEIGQHKAINALQFGYDIESVPKNFIFRTPPKIVVMIWPRQTGKTTGVAVAVATILCLQPGVKIGCMGMSEESAKNLVDRIRSFLIHSPFKSQVDKSLKMEILMKHGGYVKAHSTSQGIRGQSYHYLLLDESAQIDDVIIEGAALDTTRKIGIRVVMLSTPRGYKGSLVKYYQQGLKTRPVICKSCFTEFPQTFFSVGGFDAIAMAKGLPECSICGHYEEDGPMNSVDEELKTRMESKTYFYGVGDYCVIAINPFTCSFYSKEEILAELRRRGNTPLARQELLGEIIAEGQNVFRREWLESCMDDTLQNVKKKHEGVNYMMGVDFGKIHDNSAIAVGHEDRNSGQVILDFLYVIKADERGNIEYEDIKNDIIEVVKYYQPIWILPDATGIGEPVIEAMQRDLRQIGWYGRIYSNKSNRLGFIFDMKSKPDLIENLVEYFARSKISIPPEYEWNIDMLVNELLNFSYEMTDSNYIKYGVQLTHDDTVIALALMVWGHKHKPWTSPLAVFARPRGGLY